MTIPDAAAFSAATRIRPTTARGAVNVDTGDAGDFDGGGDTDTA